MQENTTSAASPLEQPKRRGRKPSVVITFDKVRIFKSFIDKKLSDKEAATDAEMPEPTFYRYAKMGLPELIKLAQKTQYDGLSPEEQKAYDAKRKNDEEFHETMAKVKALREAREIERKVREAKKAEEYAKQHKKHPFKSKMWQVNTDNKIDGNIFGGQETKCYLCGKVFLAEDRARYAYKIKYENSNRFFCSHGCLTIFKKRHGLAPRRLRK